MEAFFHHGSAKGGMHAGKGGGGGKGGMHAGRRGCGGEGQHIVKIPEHKNLATNAKYGVTPIHGFENGLKTVRKPVSYQTNFDKTGFDPNRFQPRAV